MSGGACGWWGVEVVCCGDLGRGLWGFCGVGGFCFVVCCGWVCGWVGGGGWVLGWVVLFCGAGVVGCV
ncbi:hypothetical protein [Pseudomonas syringae group genomosp. 7]|uniref:hypothetical protein n=1 Tax=Pseudomonas syringae group genomosp. 7 TaxID=251699 RepID=UPI00376F963C